MGKNNGSNFFIRRFHSLIALIPIGLFLCVHLLLNSSVFLNGNESYLQVIEFMKNAPFIEVLELVLIALPIIFHAIYGFYIVYVAKNNMLKYKYMRNWNFYFQRITAVIVTAFLLWHVITLRFLIHDPQEIITTFATMLGSPVYFVLYAIGVVSAIYHFTNGLFTFCITWGICVGTNAQKVFSRVSIGLFIVMSIFAVAILATLATMALPV